METKSLWPFNIYSNILNNSAYFWMFYLGIGVAIFTMLVVCVPYPMMAHMASMMAPMMAPMMVAVCHD